MDEILVPEGSICGKCGQPASNEILLQCRKDGWHLIRRCCLIASRNKPADKPVKHWQTLEKNKKRAIK